MSAVPSYLKGYEALYQKDPRAAAVEWHANAKWGLFVHYALASKKGFPKPKLMDRAERKWLKGKK